MLGVFAPYSLNCRLVFIFAAQNSGICDDTGQCDEGNVEKTGIDYVCTPSIGKYIKSGHQFLGINVAIKIRMSVDQYVGKYLSISA